VLVGDDGVVRVSDFGLVRMVEPEAPAPAPVPGHAPLLAGTLTATRAVMGTPAYMAPEQHAGLATDARTDQFSFCVALWEALYGDRPFAGATLTELAAAVARGAPREPPADTRVPTWLRAALLRGLAADPGRRWPTMSALLAELSSDPEARRRRRVWTAAATAFVLAALGLLGHATLTGREQAAAASQRAAAASRRAAAASQRAEVASDERDRALHVATREAVRARDTLRMSALREIEGDPTSTALILQEVEAPERTREWTQTALATLTTPISAAVLRGHSHTVTTAGFLGEHDELVVTGSTDASVRVWRRDGVGDPQVLRHARPLDAVVVHPDRRRFVSLGEPTARLWTVDPAAGAPVTALRDFPGDADTELAAFTPDGRRLAIADRQGTVRLWEVDTGQLLARLGSHEARVFAIAFDREGRRLATGDGDGGLRLWRTDGGPHERLLGLTDTVSALHIGADGQVLASSDARARVWTGAGEPRLDLRGHTGDIKGAAASPDGLEYATASLDRTVRRWDAVTGRELARLEHGSPVQDLAYSPDGRWLATIADDHARLWRRDDRHVVHELRGHAPDGLVFSRDSARLLTYSSDHTARVWELGGLVDARVFRAPGGGAAAVFGGCDLGRVAALGADGTLRLWDCADRRPALAWRLTGAQIHDLEVDAGLTRAAFVDEVGVWLVALADGRPRRIGVHPRLGWRVTFSPDGRHLVSTGYDRSARIWDLDGEAPPIVLSGHTAPLVWDAAWSPDGATVATIGNDRTVRIWAVGAALAERPRGPLELQAAQVFTGHARGAKTIAFSPDGRRVLTSSPDATARIWDPAGVADPVVLSGHRGALYDAAWSPDGARVATASEDGTARVWAADGAGPPLVLRGHRAGVSTIAWHPDGRALVTASEDGTARVWAADSGVTSDVYAASAAVHAAHFTGDGEQVLLAVADGTARLWRPGLDFHPDPAAVMERLRAATTACLTARARELVLLEDADEARAAHAACEARHQRTPDPNEGVQREPPVLPPPR